AQHPRIRESLVLAREVAGDRRLVAYLTCHDSGEELDVGLLRAWLRDRLPECMIPLAFVRLERMPLGANGKIDRSALPALASPCDSTGEARSPDASKPAPPTEAERRRILVDWNQTQRAYPRDKTIHELFEAQTHATPEATAVVFADTSLTYFQLNSKANQ